MLIVAHRKCIGISLYFIARMVKAMTISKLPTHHANITTIHGFRMEHTLSYSKRNEEPLINIASAFIVSLNIEAEWEIK